MYSPLRFLPQVLLHRRPIHLTLFVTARCNAKCGFCFTRAREDASAGRGELSIEEITLLSGSMGTLLWLAISGGEPYLRDDIAEIAEVFYKLNRPSIILLPTNALMPELIRERTRAILRACPKSIIAVKLSLDGIGPNHDALRGVPGAFQRVLETYAALAPMLGEFRNFELGVNTVFCPENQDEMADIAEFVSREMPLIRTHTVSLVRGVEAAERVDPVKYLDAALMIERSIKCGDAPVYGFRGARIKAAQDVLQRRAIHRTLVKRKAQMPCYAGRLNVTVTERGEVYPCEAFTPEMSLGNIRGHGCDIGEVLRTKKAREVVEAIKSKGCFCTHECYMMTNILFNPSMYPALAKEALSIHKRRVT